MNRVSKVASIFGAATIALSLTACGGDSSEYCDEIENVGAEFSDVDEAMSDPDAMSNAADSFQSIADAAPDDIKEDWEAMADGISTFSDIDFEDPEAMQDPEVQEQLAGIEDMESNFTNVEEHAQEECDLDMNEL